MRALLTKHLLTPKVIFGATFAGVLFGVYCPTIALELKIIGKIYLNLLQMCVLPILVTAVVSSVGKLLKNEEAKTYFRRLLIVFLAGLTFCALIGTAMGAFMQVGSGLGSESKIAIGKLISDNSVENETTETTISVLGFIADMVPKNVFESITRGRSLRVLFFALFLGLALGSTQNKKSERAIDMLDAFYCAFVKMISWFMNVLPLGVFCIFASQTASTGLEVFFALGRFVFVLYLGGLCLLTCFVLMLRVQSRLGALTVMRAIRQPLLVAIGTSSSFVSIPAALNALIRLGYNRRTADLIIPLGTSLNPLGSTLMFSIIAVFMGQLYEVPMNFSTYMVIALGSIATSIAAAGAPGAAVLGMMAIVLGPLGLPLEPAIAIVLAVLPALDPCITAVNVIGNCASASFIADKVGVTAAALIPGRTTVGPAG